MSQLKVQNTTAIEWEGELDDADLMAVTGGNTTVNDVTGTLADSGNSSHPTSSAITLAGGFVTASGGYISNNVGGFAEGALQGTNKTLVDTGNAV